ncbi:IS66 family transposase, partial [Xanthobacter sp. DSM 24535]|uniref:IS66 family transposase n=1 Tax=Roseixanthobacter psychrophilus TaxID=3119917 RepID=UPI00372AA84A
KANRPERERKGRKGRPGVARVLAGTPDEVAERRAISCPHCEHGLPPDGQTLAHEYDHVDIPPVSAHTTRVRIFSCRCPGCGAKVRGTPPEGMEPGTPFGPRLHAFVAYLHHHHAIAYGRLSRLFKEIWNLSISEGAIANALKRCGRGMAGTRQDILKLLREAGVMCSDETGARIKGRSAWEWVFAGPDAVLHEMADTRGAVVPRIVLDGHRPEVWVSDRFTAQTGHGRDAQVCLAHVLRDVQYAIDEGDRTFAPGVQKLLRWVVAKHRSWGAVKPATMAAHRRKADEKLDALMALPVSGPAHEKLRKQVLGWRAWYFTCLDRPDVPPTNNFSERALRPSVIMRKVTNGFRSWDGAHGHATIRSVIGTGALNGITPLQAIEHAIAGKPICLTA